MLESWTRELAVPVLVLEALAVQAGAASGGTEHEATAASVGQPQAWSPVRWNRTSSRRCRREPSAHRGGIRRGSRLERRHGAGLGDALLQDLAVRRFAIGKDQVGVDWLVLLARLA